MPWPPFSWCTAFTMVGYLSCQAWAFSRVLSFCEPSSTMTICTSSA